MAVVTHNGVLINGNHMTMYTLLFRLEREGEEWNTIRKTLWSKESKNIAKKMLELVMSMELDCSPKRDKISDPTRKIHAVRTLSLSLSTWRMTRMSIKRIEGERDEERRWERKREREIAQFARNYHSFIAGARHSSAALVFDPLSLFSLFGDSVTLSHNLSLSSLSLF